MINQHEQRAREKQTGSQRCCAARCSVICKTALRLAAAALKFVDKVTLLKFVKGAHNNPLSQIKRISAYNF